jgi:hypothetical protein
MKVGRRLEIDHLLDMPGVFAAFEINLCKGRQMEGPRSEDEQGLCRQRQPGFDRRSHNARGLGLRGNVPPCPSSPTVRLARSQEAKKPRSLDRPMMLKVVDVVPPQRTKRRVFCYLIRRRYYSLSLQMPRSVSGSAHAPERPSIGRAQVPGRSESHSRCKPHESERGRWWLYSHEAVARAGRPV